MADLRVVSELAFSLTLVPKKSHFLLFYSCFSLMKWLLRSPFCKESIVKVIWDHRFGCFWDRKVVVRAISSLFILWLFYQYFAKFFYLAYLWTDFVHFCTKRIGSSSNFDFTLCFWSQIKTKMFSCLRKFLRNRFLPISRLIFKLEGPDFDTWCILAHSTI